MPNVDALIATARELQSLLTKRRRLRRQLRTVEHDVKHTRKLLAGLKAAAEGRRPDVAPSRLTGGVTGIVPAAVERAVSILATAPFEPAPYLCTCGHDPIEHEAGIVPAVRGRCNHVACKCLMYDTDYQTSR